MQQSVRKWSCFSPFFSMSQRARNSCIHKFCRSANKKLFFLNVCCGLLQSGKNKPFDNHLSERRIHSLRKVISKSAPLLVFVLLPCPFSYLLQNASLKSNKSLTKLKKLSLFWNYTICDYYMAFMVLII